MKKLILLTLLLALSLAAPALAQEGTVQDGSQPEEVTTQREGTTQDRPPAKKGTEGEKPADSSPGPPPGEEFATLTFELAVEGTPPADATFFGNLQTGEGGPGSFTPLTDADGDGLYTGSTTTPRFGPGPRPVPPGVEPLSFGVEIVQGKGTQGSLPGQPITVIKDFGAVPMNDQTFSASVSFSEERPGPGDNITATGVLRDLGNNCNECAHHAITDEASDIDYYLTSDRVDLDAYVGERATVTGVLQIVGENLLYVTSVEPAGGSGDTVTVTFELTIDGDVPDGKTLSVDTGIADVAQPVFCSTIDFDRGSLPVCEDGETYSDTFDIPADSRLSYEYAAFDLGYGGYVETFAADSRRFTEDETVSATYRPGDPGNNRKIVEATGTLEKLGVTTYQYGTHAITDEGTNTFYALRSEVVDLDEYVGERVTLYGSLAPGYEDGQVEGGPPLMDVYTVVPANDPSETVTVTYELAVEGEAPEDATFFGMLNYEPVPVRLTDPDGNGTYTGSTPPTLVPTGDTQPAWMVQGTGTRGSVLGPQFPGDPARTIEDFGEVTFDEDTTLRASVSFEDDGGFFGGGSDDGSGSSGFSSRLSGLLPSTGGGMALTMLGAGILLVAGGFLVRRIF